MHKRLGLEAVRDADDVLANAGCNRQRGDARRYLGLAFQIPLLAFRVPQMARSLAWGQT
ncbi:hypothetical protein ACWYXN_24555 [Janthinobacterium aestuarii]